MQVSVPDCTPQLSINDPATYLVGENEKLMVLNDFGRQHLILTFQALVGVNTILCGSVSTVGCDTLSVGVVHSVHTAYS